MKNFDFFNDIKQQKQKELYGCAWLDIVGSNRENGLQTMRKLSDEGFVEASIALAMFIENSAERKLLYKKAADSNNCEGLWAYSSFLKHSYIPDPTNADDAEWETTCLKAARYGSVDGMNEMGNIYNRRNQFAESMYWYAMANFNDHPQGEISVNGITKKWISAGKPTQYIKSDYFSEKQHKIAIFLL